MNIRKMVGNKNFAPFFTESFPTFCAFLRRYPVKTPPYLGPTDVFSKKPTCDCSSALNKQIAGEKVQLIRKTADSN